MLYLILESLNLFIFLQKVVIYIYILRNKDKFYYNWRSTIKYTLPFQLEFLQRRRLALTFYIQLLAWLIDWISLDSVELPFHIKLRVKIGHIGVPEGFFATSK